MIAHFILKSPEIRERAAEYVRKLPLEPLPELTIQKFVKTRSLPQNSRYWASLTQYLDELNQSIQRIADFTGYSAIEVRRLIAREEMTQPEHVAILFANTPEAAHDILKLIVGIPTSTRLGTKEFIAFEEQMVATIALISGEVNNFAARMTQ